MLEKVGLSEAKNKKVGAYSRGMRQRLGLADALIKKPQIVILDEPTLGLDPEGMKEFLELIKNLSKEGGMTVLLSSHHLHQVQEICDRVGIFVKGKLIAKGTVSELAKELFSTELYAFEVTVDSIEDKLISKLMEVEGVKKVEKNGESLIVHAERDVSGEIAKVVVKEGYNLAKLVPKSYGLDDIYHRYFEGVQ